MTCLMPGTVSEVSATLVARTMRRCSCGAKILFCSSLERRAKRGRISVRRGRAVGVIGEVLAQNLGGLADFALAGEEDEHIAVFGNTIGRLAPEFIDGFDDALFEVDVLFVFAVAFEWSEADFNGVGSAGDFDDRGRDGFTSGLVIRPRRNRRGCEMLARNSGGSIVALVTISLRSGRRGRSWRR